MYGDLGHKLVLHAKRTQALANLPPYQTDIVRSIASEVQLLRRTTEEILEPFGAAFNPAERPDLAYTVFVHQLAMRWNFRCLVGYHRVRDQRIKALCWSGVDVMDLVQGPPAEGAEEGAAANDSVLSPEEQNYAQDYADLLAQHKSEWDDIDLMGSLDPPRDLFVDVRVLKDAGEIQTEYGSITLTKNSQLFVRRSDVERLIAQGYLQELS